VPREPDALARSRSPRDERRGGRTPGLGRVHPRGRPGQSARPAHAGRDRGIGWGVPNASRRGSPSRDGSEARERAVTVGAEGRASEVPATRTSSHARLAVRRPPHVVWRGGLRSRFRTAARASRAGRPEGAARGHHRSATRDPSRTRKRTSPTLCERGSGTLRAGATGDVAGSGAVGIRLGQRWRAPSCTVVHRRVAGGAIGSVRTPSRIHTRPGSTSYAARRCLEHTTAGRVGIRPDVSCRYARRTGGRPGVVGTGRGTAPFTGRSIGTDGPSSMRSAARARGTLSL
jgi:hypothetical protein